MKNHSYKTNLMCVVMSDYVTLFMSKCSTDLQSCARMERDVNFPKNVKNKPTTILVHSKLHFRVHEICLHYAYSIFIWLCNFIQIFSLFGQTSQKLSNKQYSLLSCVKKWPNRVKVPRRVATNNLDSFEISFGTLNAFQAPQKQSFHFFCFCYKAVK